MTDIQRIINDLEQQRAAIDRAIAALREVSGTAPSGGVQRAAGTMAKRRTLSAEGKARIAEAQRKRWADQRAGSARQMAPEGGTGSAKTTGPDSGGKRGATPAKPGKKTGAKRTAKKGRAKSAAQPGTAAM